MTVTITLRVFYICLIVCAAMVIGGIWFGKQITSPLYFQTTATLFVVGLASFLMWFSLTLRAILKRMQ